MGRLAISRGKGPFDTVPNAFPFTAVTGAALSTLFQSNTITLAGMTPGIPTAVTLSGGQYTKDGGAPATGATTGINGTTFALLLTSSALNSTLTSATLTVGGVTSTYNVTTTSSSVPASVATPVVGTDLTAIWNLQTSGTGPRTGFTNGTWSGSIDAYLSGKGVVPASDGALYLNVGAGNVVIDAYDFAAAPCVYVNGSGTCTFNDCAWNSDQNKGVNSPKDSGGTFITTTSTLVVTLNYCTLDKAITYMSAGTLIHNYCRIKNQIQIISSGQFNATVAQTLGYDHCYITGGGVAPAGGAHVELIQQIPNAASAPTGTFYCTNTMLNFTDGQATAVSWGNSWTGVWSVGDVLTTLSNNIFIGIIAVNANPINPNVINCVLAYGTDTGTNATVTNNVMETGLFGYTKNQNGTANRVVDGGGNRSYANGALTSADFG